MRGRLGNCLDSQDISPRPPTPGDALIFRAPGGWTPSPAESFNVRDFGAVSDGVTDDYAAVTRAIAAALAAGGGEVFFPVAVTRTSRGIRVPGGVTLAGSNSKPVSSLGVTFGSPYLPDPWADGTSCLYCTSTTDDAVTFVQTPVIFPGFGPFPIQWAPNIRDLFVLGPGSGSTTGVVPLVVGETGGGSSIAWDNVTIANFGFGTKIIGGIGYLFCEGLEVFACGDTGVHIDRNGTTDIFFLTFHKGNVQNCINRGVYIGSSNFVRFQDFNIEVCGRNLYVASSDPSAFRLTEFDNFYSYGGTVSDLTLDYSAGQDFASDVPAHVAQPPDAAGRIHRRRWVWNRPPRLRPGVDAGICRTPRRTRRRDRFDVSWAHAARHHRQRHRQLHHRPERHEVSGADRVHGWGSGQLGRGGAHQPRRGD